MYVIDFTGFIETATVYTAKAHFKRNRTKSIQQLKVFLDVS